jgi:hypothetical protein
MRNKESADHQHDGAVMLSRLPVNTRLLTLSALLAIGVKGATATVPFRMHSFEARC